MSVPDEQRQATAIRMALGTEDAEVTRAAAGGFNVRISDERAALALDLYDRLGASSVADTFVTSGALPVLASTLSGSAADRERYVNERARQLAKAYSKATTDRMGHGESIPDRVKVFRDLIDRGVLK